MDNLKADFSNGQIKATYDPKATRIVATTNDIDRDGEIVDPKGVSNFKEFMGQNPVILWQHRHNEAPVGKATGGRVQDSSIELDIEWAPTPMGQEVKALYDNGFMNSFSIGFIPRQSENINGTFTWTQWELLEVSAVSIPANPMANVIRSAEKQGLNVPTVKSVYGEAGTKAPQELETEDAAESLDAVRQDESGNDIPTKETMMSDEKTIDVEAIRKEAAEQARKAYEAELAEKAEQEKIEAERKELAELRERVAEESQRKSVEKDVEVKATGGAEEYRGVNMAKAHKSFVDLQERKGNQKAAQMAEADGTKNLLKAFVDMQQRAMSDSAPVTKDMTNTDAAGGYLNVEQVGDLLAYARLNSVALRRADVINMTSDVMKVPVENAKVSLGFTDEDTEATETSATFTQTTLTAGDLDGYADVSMHLEMDSTTPIAALLLDQFTESYGQLIDSAVFAAPGDPISGVFLNYGRSEVFDSGSTSFSEVLASNLINAIGKLERPRRQNAAWYIGRTALWTYLNNLKDGNDNPYLARDFTTAMSQRLLGFPVEETEYAPDDAVSTAMAIFGDLSKFKIGNRLGNLTLFRDPYSLSAQHYVRYVFWTRVAFANPLPNSFVAIATPAS